MGTSRGVAAGAAKSDGAEACRRKFLRYFPGGLADETYVDWERGYKWEAHERWEAALGKAEFRRLLRAGEFSEAAARAVRVEQKTRYSMILDTVNRPDTRTRRRRTNWAPSGP